MSPLGCLSAEYAETIKINVEDVKSYDQLMSMASQDGDDVVFDFGGDSSLTLDGVELAQLDESMFVFI